MQLFGSGILIATQKLDATGATVSNPTPIRIAVLQDVSVDIDFETKQNFGEKQFAVAIGRGKGKIAWKAKTGDFNGRVLGNLLLGTSATAVRKGVVIDEALAVPGSGPYTITIAPPGSGTFVADLGVINAATGVQLTRVASSPATGQYSLNAGTGVYTFAAADTGAALLISYEYTIASSASSSLYTINNNLMGYIPTFSAILFNRFGANTSVFKLNTNVLSKMSLPFKNDDFTVNDLDCEAFDDGTGIGFCSTY